MTPWQAARLASLLCAEERGAVVEVIWSDDGTEWGVSVEHTRDAGPIALARALRAMADALEETAN